MSGVQASKLITIHHMVMKTLLFANEQKGNAIKFQKNQPIETIALTEQTANRKYLVNFCL